MLCDHCGKNPATASIKQTVNGQTKLFHLCRDCAEQFKLSSFFSHPFFDTSSLFSGLFQQADSREGLNRAKRCPNCGAVLQGILSTGHLGCSSCVETFGEELLPTIRKIHGNAVHTGKVPQTASIKIKTKRQIELLNEQLKKAISVQNFEEAAQLRDEINRLKEQVKRDD